MKKVGGRFALLALVVVLSVVFFLPSYKPLYQALPDWARKILPDKGITLGLDLQGGIHMVMEVDEDRAVEIAVERSVNSLQDLLVDKKLPAESVKRTASNQITIQFANAELKSQIQKLSDKAGADYRRQGMADLSSILGEGAVQKIQENIASGLSGELPKDVRAFSQLGQLSATFDAMTHREYPHRLR